MPRAAVAYYGDDFTGSVDVLLQFARYGLAGRLFTAMPSPQALREAAEAADVVGIAGIARSLPTEQLSGELSPVFEALRDLGVPVVQYKACSTADSSPTLGSIGRVIEVGRAVFGERPVPMLFAQPDFGRYTVFGHHFAREGDTVYRLDRQPTMSNHPSTPMRESDLARHFSLQTSLPIRSLACWNDGEPLASAIAGARPFASAIAGADDAEPLAAAIAGTDAAALVLDALTDEHVEVVGRAVRVLAAAASGRNAGPDFDPVSGPVFAIGSGGLSRGLAAASGAARREVPASGTRSGPVLAVSGSRSPQTRRQADAAAAAGWLAQPLRLDQSAGAIADVVAALASGRSVVLTSDDADVPDGAGALEAIAEAAASVIRAAVRAGATRRVIVCGGDTSSRVTRLLGVDSLSITANPVANVVLLRAHSLDPEVDGLELLLKGGQVGPADLFELVRG
ncbi:four-carbon acid sugar kinase family protein [Microbacterium sp. F51-2R]|uniref:four-carbon acid sugar kinase family protein n=1 Tax=Microbacterium sp. F51-2R TaxID=3445777 RepID=UPI003FA10F7A